MAWVILGGLRGPPFFRFALPFCFGSSGLCEVWFLVCADWLSKWKLFASGKGGLPGPISNHNLVGPDGHPLPGKKAIHDFRGVNAEVWNFWQSRHGGGPEIKRQKLELYVPTARPKMSAWVNGPPASAVMAMAKSVVPAPSVPMDPPKPFAQFATEGKEGSGRCDKCDGRHATRACPFFKKEREKHPDAHKLLGKKHLVAASDVEEARMITRARVVRQPGDGSCLFHSVAYGLQDGSNAGSLRKGACDFMARNPNTEIMDTPLGEWINYDSRCGVSEYVSSMRRGAWGGGLEMAVVALQKGVQIDVYEGRQGGFARIARFGTRSKAPLKGGTGPRAEKGGASDLKAALC
mgnify:CR=1 FL=1